MNTIELVLQLVLRIGVPIFFLGAFASIVAYAATGESEED